MKALKKFLNEYGMDIADTMEEATETEEPNIDEIAEHCENWLMINEFCKCYTKMKHSGEHMVAQTETGGGIIESIEDELEGAEGYIDKWTATGNEAYKTLAKDELRHGETLMKMAKLDPSAAVDPSLLKGLEAARLALLGKLG